MTFPYPVTEIDHLGRSRTMMVYTYKAADLIDIPVGTPAGDSAGEYTRGWRARMRGEDSPDGVWACEGWCDADYRLQHDRRYLDHPARTLDKGR